jgi:SAM-dependent methyltransferase
MAAYYRDALQYHARVAEITGERPAPEERELFDVIARYLGGGAKRLRVLELGCGRADSADTLLSMVGPADYVGLDLSSTALRTAQIALPQHGFLVGDVTELPFRDSIFDVCFFLCVLEHAVYPDTLLREAVRVVRPGGLAAFIVPVSDLPWLLPNSLRHRARSRSFVARATASRWIEALRIRYMSNFYAFRTVDEPWVLDRAWSGPFEPDDDQVYWGWSHEIEKFLHRLDCDVVFRRGRDITSYVANGRRPAVDVLRRLVFLAFRASMSRLDPTHYTTAISLVAQKRATHAR